MAKPRASIFDDLPNLDIGGFAPKTETDSNAPSAEQVRAVAQGSQFRSREAVAPKPSPKREPRRYRTGRNVQFSAKARKEVVEAFYAISETQGWVLGYTLERAIEALQRELESDK
jgi:hypothetical protein